MGGTLMHLLVTTGACLLVTSCTTTTSTPSSPATAQPSPLESQESVGTPDPGPPTLPREELTDPSTLNAPREVSLKPRPGSEIKAAWSRYPWAEDDGLACPPPITSPGVRIDPSTTGVVVVIGDSLVREARYYIAEGLSEVGFDVVFVCWGGKSLSWGQEQVGHLKELGLTPSCLVFNLGTNDLKGTTAQGLADAVPLETVRERLGQLLLEVSDIPDVFVVDLAADLSVAPGTMAEVGDAPGAWADAVQSSGVGAVIPWSDAANSDGQIAADGIHDSVDGQQTRGRLIAEYVARDCT